MYYIGIDWGLNKTGLAIADDELRIATALAEVKTVDLLSQIKKMQTDYGEVVIVFGTLGQAEQFSTGNDKKMQIAKEKALEEIKALGVKTETAEEMLTTKIAQQNLLASGKKMVSKKDNSESAKIILQGWLDANFTLDL